MLKPPDQLAQGLRGLGDIPGFTRLGLSGPHIVGTDESVWALKFILTIDSGAPELVPPETEWYAKIASTYPLGSVSIYPALTNSIESTFPHQLRNTKHESRGWRNGKLCLDTPEGVVNLLGNEHEPFTAGDRLRWYIEQARTWLQAASHNQLRKAGDLYELPDLSPDTQLYRFGYVTDNMQPMTLEQGKMHRKVVSLHYTKKKVLIVLRQDDISDALSGDPGMPFIGLDCQASFSALVLPLPDAPVVNFYQAPNTVSELQLACHCLGVDFLGELKRNLHHIREEKIKLVLFGWQIPSVVGADPVHWHWQALHLVNLSSANARPLNGFRNNAVGLWKKDRLKGGLKNDQELVWLESEDWSSPTLLGRGKLQESVSGSKVGIIGVGALGSCVTELLARGGTKQFVLVDGDDVKAGNLVRHTLTSLYVGSSKVSAVKAHIETIQPDIVVKDIRATVESLQGESLHALLDCDIVIDTTGSDQVLDWMQGNEWGSTKLVSCSIGFAAKRIYLGYEIGGFASEEFKDQVLPFLKADIEGVDPNDFPRDGLGCWYPTFPASATDVWKAASTFVATIESLCEEARTSRFICVWELEVEPLLKNYHADVLLKQ